MAKEKISYDIFWKDLITIMLDDFVAFTMPDLHEQIDYSVPPIFLEQEFDKLISDLKKRGIKFCDKLVKVRLKNGTDKWLFIHIEIQKNKDSQLPLRMFIYFYRIFDKYGIDGTEIEAIAVFLHQTKQKKYNRFAYQSGETQLTYEYRTTSIFDYAETDLYQNKNPFSLVILASQKALQKTSDAEQQLSFKRRFTRMAYERGIAKHKIAAILQFVYYAIQLPEEFDNQYVEYFHELLNHNDMNTLQAAWNETWRGEKFDMFFGDVLQERMAAAQKKIEDLYRINAEVRREKDEAKREKDEAKRREDEAKREKDEAKRREDEAKRKEEELLIKSVLKFWEKKLPVSEISEALEIPEEKIKIILAKNEEQRGSIE